MPGVVEGWGDGGIVKVIEGIFKSNKEDKMRGKGTWLNLWGMASVAILLLAGCKTPESIGIHIGDSPKPKVSEKPGPPSHAPAYGRRAKHKYNYYPDAEVYYDSGSRNYFYLSGGKWQVSVSLPDSLRIKLGSSVSLELGTDKPYEYHDENRKKYPPGQMKKKEKKKGKGKKWD